MDEFVKLIEKSPRYIQIDSDKHDSKLRKYDNRYYLSLISKPFHV